MPDLEALIWLIVLAAFIGFCFWKYPSLLKEIFSFKKNISDTNEPTQPVVAKVLRHEIVKHDYYKAYNGNLWPRWHCKCGASDKEPTSIYQSLEATQADARRKGQKHVSDANKADEMLAKSNGMFAF